MNMYSNNQIFENFDLSDFRRTSPLGEGAFFQVFLYEKDDKIIAVKTYGSSSLAGEAIREKSLKSEAAVLLKLKDRGRSQRVVAFKGMTWVNDRIALVTEALVHGWQKLEDKAATLSVEQKIRLVREMVALFEDLMDCESLSSFEFKKEHLFVKLSANTVALKAIDFGITDKIEAEEIPYRKLQLAEVIYFVLKRNRDMPAVVNFRSITKPLLEDLEKEIPSFGQGLLESLFTDRSIELQVRELTSKLDERINDLEKEHGKTPIQTVSTESRLTEQPVAQLVDMVLPLVKTDVQNWLATQCKVLLHPYEESTNNSLAGINSELSGVNNNISELRDAIKIIENWKQEFISSQSQQPDVPGALHAGPKVDNESTEKSKRGLFVFGQKFPNLGKRLDDLPDSDTGTTYFRTTNKRIGEICEEIKLIKGQLELLNQVTLDITHLKQDINKKLEEIKKAFIQKNQYESDIMKLRNLINEVRSEVDLT